MNEIVFWKSNTCTKCAQVLPKLQAMADKVGIPVVVANADEEPEAAMADGVMGFPTVLVKDTATDETLERLGANLTMPQLQRLVQLAAD